MKRALVYFSLFVLPAACLLVVLLSVSHFTVSREIAELESLQDRLIERNKRFITQESALTSPGRIRDLAVTELGLAPADPDQIIYFQVDETQAAGND